MAALRSIAVFATLGVVLAGCQTVTEVLSGMDKPSARIASVNLAALDLEGAELLFDVAIANPYDVALPLTDLRYALSSRGRGIVSGDAPLDGTIPARGERTIPVPAAVRFADLLAALSDVRPGAVVPYDAELDLIVDVPSLAGAHAGRLSIPLRHQGELPVPAPPNVSIQAIEWEEMSLTRARAVVRLDIENVNSFPLDLRSLSYALSLSGLDVAAASIDDVLSLQANERGMIEIPISVSPVSLSQAALAVLQGARAEYEIAGEIAADTPYGLVHLPFNRQGEARMRRP